MFDVVMVGNAVNVVVVVFLLACVKVRTSEFTVTVPVTSACPVIADKVIASLKDPDGAISVRIRDAALVASYKVHNDLVTR